MFNQVIKWTIIAGLWKKYKRQVLATVAFLVSFYLVSFFHQEYLEYAKLAGKTDLASSFFIKWIVNLVVIAVYLGSLKAFSVSNQKSKLRKDRAKRIADIIKASEPQKENKHDPFATIRKKKVLKSKGDYVIDNSSSNKN